MDRENALCRRSGEPPGRRRAPPSKEQIRMRVARCIDQRKQWNGVSSPV
ncbi:hypothetical protein Bra5_CH00503 [Rhizobium phaseoli Brasil 5]|nr:hypothetical protein Bra5_CH00503 [Rhizobium phaseoli Brasil 5]